MSPRRGLRSSDYAERADKHWVASEQKKLTRARRTFEVRDTQRSFAPYGDPYALAAAHADAEIFFIQDANRDEDDIGYDINYDIFITKGNLLFFENIDALATFIDSRIDLIGELAAKILQGIVVKRMASLEVPPLIVEGVPTSNEALDIAAGRIQDVLRAEPVRLSPGKWGFANKKDLDKILITDRGSIYQNSLLNQVKVAGGRDPFTRYEDPSGRASRSKRLEEKLARASAGQNNRSESSPFRIAWMILQFGTGQYARPTRNQGDDRGTKGGKYGPLLPKGRWYWNPKKSAPVIWGQKPTRFLYDERAGSKRARQDASEVQSRLAVAFEQILIEMARKQDAALAEEEMAELMREEMERGI